jgi:hypothetical protein
LDGLPTVDLARSRPFLPKMLGGIDAVDAAGLPDCLWLLA